MSTPRQSYPSLARVLAASAVALVLLAGAARGLAAAEVATTWKPWEHTLVAARDHANPYRDVTLRVAYTGPDGRSFSAHGFWDGDGAFRLRTAFPAPGEWTWTTPAPTPPTLACMPARVASWSRPTPATIRSTGTVS